MYVYAISSLTRYGAHWATVRVSNCELPEDMLQHIGRMMPPTWKFIPNGPFRVSDVVSIVHEMRIVDDRVHET